MLYRILMTFSAIAMMPAIYIIKSGCSLILNNKFVTSIAAVMVPIVFYKAASRLIHYNEEEDLSGGQQFELADSNYLPVYLGYFFIALSINDYYTLIFVFLILFLFSFTANVAIFNPILLLYGYHFYYLTTREGSRIFVVCHGDVIRNINGFNNARLYRINNTTYFMRSENE